LILPVVIRSSQRL